MSISIPGHAAPAVGFEVPLAFTCGAGTISTVASMFLGAALAALGIRRDAIQERYGNWNRLIAWARS